MVSDELLDRDELGFEEWSITPNPGDLVPDSVAREREREQFRSELRDDPPAVVITHTDADGLSSAALVVDYMGPDTVVQPIDYTGPYSFKDVLYDLNDLSVTDTPVYVLDFNLDDVSDEIVEMLEDLTTDGCQVIWYDHHQWEIETYQTLVGVDGVVGRVDEDECTASLLARELGTCNDDGIEANFDEHLEDLAECTKDIDLWIRDDPRSERLNVWARIADQDVYIRSVLAHGADLPVSAQEQIDEWLDESQELETAAVERVTGRRIHGYSLAMTYSSGGRSNVIGNRLVEEHEMDYDIAVVCRPTGISIYAHSNRETFARCHELAAELGGGGGHPTAAGCSIPVESFRELAEYWSTAGGTVWDDIIEAALAVTDDETEVTPDAE